MLNIAVMTGRLVADPELRHTSGDTPVTTFRIAVRRDFAKKGEEPATDFFDVVAWRSTAEFVCDYFRKGSPIQVVGRMENREWTDKNGQPRVTAELVADRAYFGESKGKAANDDADPYSVAAVVGISTPPDFDPFS